MKKKLLSLAAAAVMLCAAAMPVSAEELKLANQAEREERHAVPQLVNGGTIRDYSPGDVNADGLVDAKDANLALLEFCYAEVVQIGHILDGEQRALADVWLSDGIVDARDSIVLIRYYLLNMLESEVIEGMDAREYGVWMHQNPTLAEEQEFPRDVGGRRIALVQADGTEELLTEHGVTDYPNFGAYDIPGAQTVSIYGQGKASRLRDDEGFLRLFTLVNYNAETGTYIYRELEIPQWLRDYEPHLCWCRYLEMENPAQEWQEMEERAETEPGAILPTDRVCSPYAVKDVTLEYPDPEMLWKARIRIGEDETGTAQYLTDQLGNTLFFVSGWNDLGDCWVTPYPIIEYGFGLDSIKHYYGIGE